MKRKRFSPKRLVKLARMRASRHPLVSLLIGLIVALVVSAILLWIVDDSVDSAYKALLGVLPPFLGEIIDTNDIEVTRAIVNLIGLIASIGSLAIITALIVNRFVRLCLRGGRVVQDVKMRDHIVICGWNSQGPTIVDELLRADVRAKQEIVILADLEKRPVDEERVEFLRGNPIRDTDLKRACIQDSSSAIVLTDFTEDPNEADAKALLIVLAIESLNPRVHTCVQILNASNRRHFERVRTDEIICLEQLGGNLAVASALNHGTSHLVSELLTFNSGSEFYRYSRPLPDTLLDKEFAEAARILSERRIILLGIETANSVDLEEALPADVRHSLAQEDEDRVVVVNPQGSYRLRQGDVLFLIAESLPGKV